MTDPRRMSTATLTPIASVAGSEVRLVYVLTLTRYEGDSHSIFRLVCHPDVKVPKVLLQLVFVLLEGNTHELPTRAHAGLLKQALQNRLDVAFGDLHPPGNFLVRETFEHEAQHAALPF